MMVAVAGLGLCSILHRREYSFHRHIHTFIYKVFGHLITIRLL